MNAIDPKDSASASRSSPGSPTRSGPNSDSIANPDAGAGSSSAFPDETTIVRSPADPEPTEATPSGPPPRRLLLVEDDGSSRSALERIYSRKGWIVYAAGTIAEAFGLLSIRPDFVILDLMLPDGEGSTLLRAIRESGMPIRVAVTTGSNDVELIGTVMRLKPDVFLSKPIRLGELDAAIAAES